MLESLALPVRELQARLHAGAAGREVYGGRRSTRRHARDDEGRYVHSEGDANWWIPSGRMFFSPGQRDTPAQELAYARQHFFLPHRYRDPFHTNAVSTESFVTYDAYDLLMVETRDALGNASPSANADDAGNLTHRNDYRVLQPRWMTDPNGNRTEVAFDALGMVVGTAVMGKAEPAPVEGDSLDGFDADLTDAADASTILARTRWPIRTLSCGDATTRLVYDLIAY